MGDCFRPQGRRPIPLAAPAPPAPAAGGRVPPAQEGEQQRRVSSAAGEIVYTLRRRKVKNLNLRVRPDGSVAVEKVRQSRPGDYDAVLMDIQMPVMNGWEAARAIRALPDPALSKIPIIALSANVFESDLRRSAESGMNAHLAKPMDVAEVQKTIEELL